jgi:hypothetical protein
MLINSMKRKKLSLEEKAAMEKEITNEWRHYGNNNTDYNSLCQGLKEIENKYYKKS